MSSKWRRFEVLLPLQFNDGRAVPSEWLADAVLEVGDHFGAASYCYFVRPPMPPKNHFASSRRNAVFILWMKSSSPAKPNSETPTFPSLEMI